jgi:hypothetical protein
MLTHGTTNSIEQRSAAGGRDNWSVCQRVVHEAAVLWNKNAAIVTNF